MASTQWPTTGLSAEVKQLITHFFSLVDLPKPDAGLQIAAEVFTEDGVFTGTGGSYKGRAELERSREKAWTTVRARRHEVQKVYLNDAEGLELIIQGTVAVDHKDKAADVHDFVAHTQVVKSEFGDPRLQKYQVLVPSLTKH